MMSILYIMIISFPTLSAFLVAPSYTTSPVLEKTLSFETLIHPLCFFVCASMFFCVASFHTPSAFLVAPSYTTSPVLEKTLSFETLVLRPLCTPLVLRCCFSVLHRFLRPPHSSLHRLTPRHLSWLGKEALI
jgi:hypothetical protein